jgi:hypothetical protein
MFWLTPLVSPFLFWQTSGVSPAELPVKGDKLGLGVSSVTGARLKNVLDYDLLREVTQASAGRDNFSSVEIETSEKYRSRLKTEGSIAVAFSSLGANAQIDSLQESTISNKSVYIWVHFQRANADSAVEKPTLRSCCRTRFSCHCSNVFTV